MDTETKALLERWIIAFCETPVLIDADLMRCVLDGTEPASPAECRRDNRAERS